jgi:hypothetical protein
MVEKKLLKIDDLARNMDRISLEIDSLKIRSIPPKHDINESLIAMRISMYEFKENTARISAKQELFFKACPSISRKNNDEDLKVIGVTPIESLFSNVNLENNGTGYESTLVK